MILGLTVILILVLFMPFTIKLVERNLEVFLFIMGVAAAFISGVFDKVSFNESTRGSYTYNISCFNSGTRIPLVTKTD